MTSPSKAEIVHALFELHGKTFPEELHIHVEHDSPSALFQLLCASLLFSARISAGNAQRAMRALLGAGLTTPKKMAEASWQDRVDVITWHGYKRYDERTATMLGDTAQLVLDRYRGDLRRLREEAQYSANRERELLKQFKGVGDVGADIFLREVQLVWDEAYPWADEKVLKAAKRLGLGNDAHTLGRLVPRRDFPRLCDALVRVDLGDEYAQVREHAA